MTNERPSTFTWIDAAGAIVLVLINSFAVTLAVPEHNDRVPSDEITGTASELQDTGARITSIRDADMKDMNDYIRAYSEMAVRRQNFSGIRNQGKCMSCRPGRKCGGVFDSTVSRLQPHCHAGSRPSDCVACQDPLLRPPVVPEIGISVAYCPDRREPLPAKTARLSTKNINSASPVERRDPLKTLVLWSRLFDWKSALLIVKPETLIGWHRKGFKLFWRWKSRPLRTAAAQRISRVDRVHGARESHVGTGSSGGGAISQAGILV